MTITDSRLGQSGSDTRYAHVEPGANSLGGQRMPVTQTIAAPEGQTSRSALGGLPSSAGLPIVDPLMFVHATAHNDLEQQRIASENRLRILTAAEPDDDGVMRGYGLDLSHPDVARLSGITDALRSLENDAKLGLCRSLRRSPLFPWIDSQVGLGEKQVARLLAAIGDPYWHLADDRPRTVSELWAYSGFHVLPLISDPDHPRPASESQSFNVGVAAKRRKGQQSNWSSDARTRAWLIASKCIQFDGRTLSNGIERRRSPYRDVYEQRRLRTSETHPEWNAGHAHNDGIRVASKAILRDLWRESKRLHEASL
jgi:hypothetical protein